MECFNLKNVVSFPTHVHQHTLDLILDDRDDPILQLVTKGHLLLDHNFIHMTLAISRPKPDKVCKTFRKLQQINHQELRDDIIHELVPDTIQLAGLVQNYNRTLRQLLDKHAPAKSKTVKKSHEQPWFNEYIKLEIILRQKKEGQWEKDNTEYRFRAFSNQRHFVANLIRKFQKQYYNEELLRHKYDSKGIFTITNKLLFGDESLPLPPQPNIRLLADNFNNFFIAKIDKIWDDLIPTQENPVNHTFVEDHYITHNWLARFELVDTDYIVKLINYTPPKLCALDPIPTKPLKRHAQDGVPYITVIINLSTSIGEVSPNLKEALLKPLLKKIHLEPVFQSYCPVSNLSYLSKLIQRTVCNQITTYTESTNNLEKIQSAYHANCSTETALLKVKTDLLSTIDNKEVTYLILLNLSAAFNTVNYTILLNRLKYCYGLSGTALSWICLYLTWRTRKVVIDGFESGAVKLTQGVPQGSVLGPVLFTLYTSPLGNICWQHHINFHCYADGQQIYLSFKPSRPDSSETCLTSLQNCITDIRLWMKTNLLKLNDSKTEFLIVGTRQQLWISWRTFYKDWKWHR